MKENRTKWSKLLIIGIALVSIIGLTSGCNNANGEKTVTETESSRKSITVQGTGMVTVKPTVVKLNLGVTSNGESVEAVQNDNQIKIDAVISALKADGIDEKDIQTSNYYISPKYDQETYTKIVGYDVNHILHVMVKDIKSAGKVLDNAVKAGANQASSMNFDMDINTEEREELYNDAVKIAMNNAEIKANAIANNLGVKLSKPAKVIEGNGGQLYYDQSIMFEGEAKAANQTSLMPGEMNVTASVTLIYEY